MASAVAVFRDNAIEKDWLEKQTDADRALSESERLEREKEKAEDAANTKFAVDALRGGLEALADGNVPHRIRTPFTGTLDELRSNFSGSVEKLHSVLKSVGQNAAGIDAGANETISAADDLSRRTEQQAASVEETAAALEQITTTIRDSAKRADNAGKLVEKARSGVERSGELMQDAVQAMMAIEKSAGEMGNIISVIDEIAFQTRARSRTQLWSNSLPRRAIALLEKRLRSTSCWRSLICVVDKPLTPICGDSGPPDRRGSLTQKWCKKTILTPLPFSHFSRRMRQIRRNASRVD